MNLFVEEIFWKGGLFQIGTTVGTNFCEEELREVCELSQIERIKNKFFYVVNCVVAFVNDLKVLAMIPRSSRAHWLDHVLYYGFVVKRMIR